jgi:LacI family transcriptional regulator
MKRPATMADVARVARVHRTTVSLALRDSPKLPLATRRRVRAVAERLGYRPNPLVAALMTSRRSRRAPVFQAPLAIVSNHAAKPDWERENTAYAQMYRGARARAAERGYALSLLWRAEPGMTSERFSRILVARGIHGIVIAPHGESSHRIGVEWERFATVELGYNLVAPNFHRVVHDYFHAMKQVWARCRERGYQRLGLLLNSTVDEKSHHLWRAAYVDEQQSLPARQRLVPLIAPALGAENVRDWLAAQKPDVVIALGVQARSLLRSQLGMRVPDEVGFVDLACYERDGSESGIFQNWPAMGAAAIDELVAMLHRGERGVPAQAHCLQISGLWAEGTTLPPRGEGKSV